MFSYCKAPEKLIRKAGLKFVDGYYIPLPTTYLYANHLQALFIYFLTDRLLLLLQHLLTWSTHTIIQTHRRMTDAKIVILLPENNAHPFPIGGRVVTLACQILSAGMAMTY